MKVLTRTSLSLLLCVVVFVGMCVFLTGCGESSETENAETSQEITTQEETTTAQTQTQETVPTETKKPKKKDQYADSAKYLSDFHKIEGGGFNVTVSNKLKGDFTGLRKAALYTMKKAHKKYGTMSDKQICGMFKDGENAFFWDDSWGDNQIYIYEDWVSPDGWQWVLSSDDWKYIEGK